MGAEALGSLYVLGRPKSLVLETVTIGCISQRRIERRWHSPVIKCRQAIGVAWGFLSLSTETMELMHDDVE